MIHKRFTEDEIIALNGNENVIKATEKYIEYTNGFKEAVLEGRRSGRTLREIFAEGGFDFDMIGYGRIEHAADNWKKCEKHKKEFVDCHHRKGRPRKKPMSDEERIAAQQKEIDRLKAENEFLRQLRRLERRHQPHQSTPGKSSS